MGFAVTPKQAQEGNFLFLVYPHLFYIIATVIASAIGINREGVNPSVMTNIARASLNICMFVPFIRAAYNWKKLWQRLFSNNYQLRRAN